MESYKIGLVRKEEKLPSEKMKYPEKIPKDTSSKQTTEKNVSKKKVTFEVGEADQFQSSHQRTNS